MNLGWKAELMCGGKLQPGVFCKFGVLLNLQDCETIFSWRVSSSKQKRCLCTYSPVAPYGMDPVLLVFISEQAAYHQLAVWLSFALSPQKASLCSRWAGALCRVAALAVPVSPLCAQQQVTVTVGSAGMSGVYWSSPSSGTAGLTHLLMPTQQHIPPLHTN